MSVATATIESTEPLTQSQLNEIAVAHDRAGKIRKAAAVAVFNGWMTGIFAFCSIPFALFSLTGVAVTAGLSSVAYNEFKGRKRLLQFDTEAPALLGWNQVGFLIMIIIYCSWMIFTGMTGEGPFAAQLKAKPELSTVIGSIDQFDQLYRVLNLAVYGTVIILSIAFQGWNAFYYFTRKKHLDAYLQETPGWVLDLQRLTPSA